MNNKVELYIKDNIKLVNTIAVKSSITASLMNTYITYKYGTSYVNDNDATTWRYYLNISGQYHFDDEKMYVVSLDTLETILFSKENLELHPLTRENYQFGTRYYYNLLNKYPNQEFLIKGILYPCDINKAIEAEDGEILSYQSDLVEEQEETLIWELSNWCKRHQVRWNVKAFMHSDSLYPAAQLGILYLNMVPRLLNLRLKRCKTREAHSFHIYMYLSSHNKLNDFVKYYTLKQKLWLYRNISYIEHNAGLKSNFNSLVDKMLTDRLIPVSEFSINHTEGFSGDYYTEYEFNKTDINIDVNIPDKSSWTLEEIYEKENPLLVENEEYNKYILTTADLQIKNSPSSTIKTKLLESKILNYNNNEVHTLPEVVVNYWPYMAAIGLYNARIEISSPRSSWNLELNVKDAFVYWVYLVCKKVGLDLKRLDRWLAIKVLIETKPTSNEVLSVSYPNTWKLKHAQEILDYTPSLLRCNTLSQFKNLVTRIFEREKKDWYRTSNEGSLWRHASLRTMYNRTKQDVWVDLPTKGSDIKDWLKEKGIEDIDYSEAELDYVIDEIFQKSTGYIEDEISDPGSIQTALIETVKRLSSYSIQFLTEINEEDILFLNWCSVRTNDVGRDGISAYKTIIDLNNSRGMGMTAGSSMSISLPQEKLLEIGTLKVRDHIDIRLENLVSISTSKQNRINSISRVETYLSTDKEDAIQGIANISSIKYLTNEQIKNIPVIFN